MKYVLLTFLSAMLVGSCSPSGDSAQTNGTEEVVEVPLPQVASGTIERLPNVPSKYVTARNVDVWLPEGYSSDKKYAVLYMHDGQMLYDAKTTWNKQEWGVDEILSQLIKEGKVQETIVVGVWNDKEYRYADYAPQKAFAYLPENLRAENLLRADGYLKFLVEELKPVIDEKYATYGDAEHTFVMGSSMGGLISMYAFCEYPNVFGAAACLSTHWTGIHESNEFYPNAFNQYMQEYLPASSAGRRIYFDYGSETLDSLYKPYQQRVDQTMRDKGYTEANWHTQEFVGADHSENSWKERLHIPLLFLLKGEAKN